MEVWVAKLTVSFLLLVEALLFGLVPPQILRSIRVTGINGRQRNNLIISCLNCFGGGVFLATAFLHLLPEVREQVVEILLKLNIKTNFAVTEFVAMVGFFLVMILEHSIVKCKPTNNTLTDRHADEIQENLHYGNNSEGESSPLIRTKQGKSYLSCDNSVSPNNTRKSLVRACGTGNYERKETGPENVVIVHSDAEADVCVREDAHPPSLHSFRSVMLFVALSLHTVFEGLAVGLQNRQTDIWQLCLAISIHKCIIALSLGLQISRHESKFRKLVLYIAIFAVICPIGIAIGTIVTEMGSDSLTTQVTQAVLEGVATGTFFYVTFFEVLNREIGESHCLVRVLFAIIGFSIIAFINLFGPTA